MAGVLFEDIFNVKDIDPEGKKFDRGKSETHFKLLSIYGHCCEEIRSVIAAFLSVRKTTFHRCSFFTDVAGKHMAWQYNLNSNFCRRICKESNMSNWHKFKVYISIFIHPCIYSIIVWNSLNYVSHSSTILSSAVAGYLKCYTEKRFLWNHINKSYRFNIRIHMYLRIQKIIIDM